jgi:hypothetical protein
MGRAEVEETEATISWSEGSGTDTLEERLDSVGLAAITTNHQSVVVVVVIASLALALSCLISASPVLPYSPTRVRTHTFTHSLDHGL